MQVAVLKGRIYDVQLITNNGGIVDIVNETNLMEGVTYMLKNLRDNDQGFLIDEDAFYAYVAMKSDENAFTTEEMQQLKNDIISTQKRIKGIKTLLQT